MNRFESLIDMIILNFSFKLSLLFGSSNDEFEKLGDFVFGGPKLKNRWDGERIGESFVLVLRLFEGVLLGDEECEMVEVRLCWPYIFEVDDSEVILVLDVVVVRLNELKLFFESFWPDELHGFVGLRIQKLFFLIHHFKP